jgi:hypothetical protein
MDNELLIGAFLAAAWCNVVLWGAILLFMWYMETR